jgi:predicted deacylase
MIIDGIKIGKGSRKTWNLIAAETAAGEIGIPVTAINGIEKGPTLAILAGCHPCELVGIMASINLSRALDPKHLAGSVIIVHLQNVMGFQFKTSYISPLDGVNMGRAYPSFNGSGIEGVDRGKEATHKAKSPTYQVADKLFNEVAHRADYLVDLHGGELNEWLIPNIEIFTIGKSSIDSKTRALAKAFGFDIVWEVPQGSIPEMPNYPQSGSLVYESVRMGIPAALCECGREGKIEEEYVEKTYQGLINVMTSLRMLQGTKVQVEPQVLVGGHVLFAKRGGLFVTKSKAGDKVLKNQILGHIIDLTGEVIETFSSPSDGIILNMITLGIANPGDMLYVIANLTK